MTERENIASIFLMVMTSEELRKRIDDGLAQRKWSMRKLHQESGVPYSWLVDLYRNDPRKLDMRRAEQVIATLDLPIEDSLKLSQTETAIIDAMQAIIGALSLKEGKFTQHLEVMLSTQAKMFQDRQQPDAMGVVNQLLNFLHSGLPGKATLAPPQSRRPVQGQSTIKSNPKNQP